MQGMARCRYSVSAKSYQKNGYVGFICCVSRSEGAEMMIHTDEIGFEQALEKRGTSWYKC